MLNVHGAARIILCHNEWTTGIHRFCADGNPHAWVYYNLSQLDPWSDSPVSPTGIYDMTQCIDADKLCFFQHALRVHCE